MRLSNAVDTRTHVLFVVDGLRGLDFTGNTVKGLAGVESVLLRVIRYMPREQYRFSVVTFTPSQNLADAHKFPCPLHVLPLKKTYDWNAAKMALRLRRLIRSQKVNIAHTFLESADIWGGLVAKLSGCPILISSRRDMGCFRSQKHAMAYRLVNPLVNQVHAVSEKVRDYCIHNDGLPPRKVVTLYNGIESEQFTGKKADDLSEKLQIEPDTPIITAVANIRPVKGIDVLIRTAAIVCRSFPQARFLIAGEVIDHNCLNELLALVQSLDLSKNVIFLGKSDDTISLLRSSTIFCMLSRSEGFSNAILEAMVCGLPCVVTDVGGNAEAVDEGQSGFLVASEDADTAADRILQLLRSPQCARQMGEHARQIIARKFTAEAMVARWAGLYDELLATHASKKATRGRASIGISEGHV
jgi:L-malate glycosyltransferase